MKINRFLLSIIISLSFITISQAQEKKAIQGFSGGMMVHTGYQFGGDNPYNLNISSPTFGIGGCAKVHLTKHFRTGFEGYFSTASMSKGVQSGSHNKVFWTGVLADWYWQKGKIVPYIGATAGGGMETAFYLFEGDKHDWKLNRNLFCINSPSLQ